MLGRCSTIPASTDRLRLLSGFANIRFQINASEHRSPSENLIDSMMSIEWAKPVATELLVIGMSRPFAAKPADDWIMK